MNHPPFQGGKKRIYYVATLSDRNGWKAEVVMVNIIYLELTFQPSDLSNEINLFFFKNNQIRECIDKDIDKTQYVVCNIFEINYLTTSL